MTSPYRVKDKPKKTPKVTAETAEKMSAELAETNAHLMMATAPSKKERGRRLRAKRHQQLQNQPRHLQSSGDEDDEDDDDCL